jgi:hypothetical protein
MRRMRGAAAFAGDDARDLDRQMGCMAGIFQIFDRQRLITGSGRRGGRQAARKMLPPPPSAPGNGLAFPPVLTPESLTALSIILLCSALFKFLRNLLLLPLLLVYRTLLGVFAPKN